jgi:hypothetical protein
MPMGDMEKENMLSTLSFYGLHRAQSIYIHAKIAPFIVKVETLQDIVVNYCKQGVK